MAKKKDELAAKVRRCLAAREAGKRAYARGDRLMDEILLEACPGQKVPLNRRGKFAVIFDQFADKAVAWKVTGIRRFELKVIER